MTEETVAWSDAKDAVRAAVGYHEKQKARKSVTMVGASEGKAPERLSKAAAEASGGAAPSDFSVNTRRSSRRWSVAPDAVAAAAAAAATAATGDGDEDDDDDDDDESEEEHAILPRCGRTRPCSQRSR